MQYNIIIRFADLWLKGNNKKDFVFVLEKNIKKALVDFKFSFARKYDHFIIFNFNYLFEKEIINILSRIPGISYVIPSWSVENDLNKIFESIIKFLPNDKKTFKLEVKRTNKNFLSSDEIINFIAPKILKTTNLKVNVKNPDITISINVKAKLTYIFFSKIKSTMGLPIGINGSTLSLISGGIDSPVASYLMQAKGLQVNYLTFVTEEVNVKNIIFKIIKLINKVTLNSRIYQPKFFIVDFTKIQQELAHANSEAYRIILMRRSFYRIAKKIANLYKIDSLTTGESIGQVASQTIESLNVINSSFESFLVFRPLISFGKNEIINIAKKISTYEISISESEDVCSAFNPNSPITRPNIKKVEKLEENLELLESLENLAISKLKVINL